MQPAWGLDEVSFVLLIVCILPHNAIDSAALEIARCSSVTFIMCCIETAKDIILSRPCYFLRPTTVTLFHINVGLEKLSVSAIISQYLGNCTRQVHGYHETLIESHRCSVQFSSPGLTWCWVQTVQENDTVISAILTQLSLEQKCLQESPEWDQRRSLCHGGDTGW